MTSFAFILGCVPLWTATGAGAVARQIMGTTVIGGMVAASVIGIFLMPAIFYLVEKLSGAAVRRPRRSAAAALPGEGIDPCIGKPPSPDLAVGAALRLHGRPQLPASQALRPHAVSRAGAAAARKTPFDRRSQVVRGLQRREAAGPDPHGVGAELRPARRGDARGSGTRESGDHPVESVPTVRRERRASRSTGSRATAPTPLPAAFLPSQNRNFGAVIAAVAVL